MRTLGEVRVLIVGWKPNSNQFMRSVLATLGLPAFTRVARTDEAMAALREHGFELVFCTSDAEPMAPAVFTKALRRDVHSRDPTIPVIIISNTGCTQKDIEFLRDAGADDIMCPPMSADAIGKRLQRLLLQARTFVTSRAFVGPDRRRSGDRSFPGEDKRQNQETIFYQPPRVKRD